MKVKSESEVAQVVYLKVIQSDPMDCSLPGSSVHGIFQARVLEWGAIAFSEAWLRVIIFLLDLFFQVVCICVFSVLKSIHKAISVLVVGV